MAASCPPAPSTPVPRAIWALGFVSLLMDVSSELIHSLLPVFMFTALAGLLWDQLGAAFSFVAGGIFATLALFAVLWRRRRRDAPRGRSGRRREIFCQAMTPMNNPGA